MRPRNPLCAGQKATGLLRTPAGVVGQFEHDTGIQIAAGRFAGKTFDRRVAARDHDRPTAHAGGQFGARFQAQRQDPWRPPSELAGRLPDTRLRGRCRDSRTGAAIAIASGRDPARTSRSRSGRLGEERGLEDQRHGCLANAPRSDCTSSIKRGTCRGAWGSERGEFFQDGSVTNTGAEIARRRRAFAGRSRRAAADPRGGAPLSRRSNTASGNSVHAAVKWLQVPRGFHGGFVRCPRGRPRS